MSTETVRPGYGYRLLTDSDTISQGDEAFDQFHQVWEPFSIFWSGKEYNRQMFVPGRRKIDVGEGYRLLDIDEVVQVGDEWKAGNGWIATMCQGDTVRVAGTPIGQSEKTVPYRRRIDTGHYIICAQENGVAYCASKRPYVHHTLEAAQIESNRLALVEGKKFVIFKAVAATEAVYREEIVRKIDGVQSVAV